MSEYRPTIGLEIHAELATRTKMFCDCMNAPEGAEVNANTCPVCVAHPGTLPTINKEAVRHVLRVGTAIGGAVADYAEFDRKSYFYPDIPKGYQISQYEHPLIKGGELAGVAVTRIHLEEDTARSSHNTVKGVSLVDFNRAGVPLMELVTEPVIHDAETAGVFARELQLLLRTLGASHANLEKGEMRVEANISVSKNENFGTKVEVKNLNSFRSVERAIAFEIARQSKLLDEGGIVVQETRGWDEGGQKTFSQRAKEGSADYRYFPEPDLPKLLLSEVAEFSPESISAAMPELPWERRARYQSLGLKETDAVQLSSSVTRSVFFDKVITEANSESSLLSLAANYLISDVAGWYSKSEKEEFSGLETDTFVELMRMIENKDLSSRGAKDVLQHMLENGGNPMEIAKSEGLIQVSDEGALVAAIRGVLEQNPSVAAEYKSGKDASLQYLVGQTMKATRGAGNPALIKELLVKEIG
ncbi:Asp-tRNA(Asn)/Glu-tRNA(Gln) amidotransferase subunit GatB [Patescibacteria group bacterium]|nr:Asp-tRNA(Asn)/Glu-tRNA(Gln) amidotransferase subunit GatB [Patescibacteria group bacterium]MBU1501110.1 Asp-tRNA(Asn)/Glu-tRNA(Gln) amidotransferase subunit GatB [Patescibacteria group bacterium]MBU2081017.1 Asp-tRNA(Asn)/Glu-tRNA(Gln) amidotransferase subunit GatB [Patescibacteria group bacterium]MBU2124108.1 Asp-tRNA(Asn)/Glu-tRNA(Gln) amidotransferase subunit GatB [Patescibacteria group bacterium]MBU2194964.1 Asp-tRNA(Asn)/Glu-tRNA(Gln) amidotransferase subunit GatB [Patescibacteria group